MDMGLIIFFVVLNIFNVVIQTIKSLVTIKGGKVSAAVINAITYGLYTVVLVYMTCELPLWLKVITVGGANLVGVYLVKWFEEKKQKTKIYKIEITTVRKEIWEKIEQELQNLSISSNMNTFKNIRTRRDNYIINTYCTSQEEKKKVFDLIKKYKVKYFVNVSK